MMIATSIVSSLTAEKVLVAITAIATATTSTTAATTAIAIAAGC